MRSNAAQYVRFASLSVYRQFAERVDRLATLLVPPDHDH